MLYITSHNVRSRETGGEGTHAFLYRNERLDSKSLPIEALREIDRRAGELIAQAISSLGQGMGNEVLAYLDVIVPEGTPDDEIRRIMAFLKGLTVKDAPVVLVRGSAIVRLSVRPDRQANWGDEIGRLVGSIEEILPHRQGAGRPAP